MKHLRIKGVSVFTLFRRLIFFIPAHLLRWIFILIIFLGWGIDSARDAWSGTE